MVIEYLGAPTSDPSGSPAVLVTRDDGLTSYGTSGSPDVHLTTGSSSSDIVDAFRLAFDEFGSVFVPSGTWDVDDFIFPASGSSPDEGKYIYLTMVGQRMRTSTVRQDATSPKTIILVEEDSSGNNLIFFNMQHLSLEAANSTMNPAEALVHIGQSDFNYFGHVIVRGEGLASGFVYDGARCLATRFTECNLFACTPWSIDLSPRAITDVTFNGCRIEGASSSGNANGIRINNSPFGHAAGADPAIETSVTLENCRFERLDGWSLFGVQGNGIVIRGGEWATTSIFLGHRTTSCTVKDVNFITSATVFNSGYGNDCLNNNHHFSTYGLPIVTNDHGYNTIFSDADNKGAFGLGSWTSSNASNGRRVFNVGFAGPDVNSLEIKNGANLTRTATLDANTYYVLRVAYATEASDSHEYGAGRIVVTDNGGSGTVLLDTGELIDEHLTRGQVSYQTYVFETGSNTNIEFKIESNQGASTAPTISSRSGDTVTTSAAHNLETGDVVHLTTTGSLPGGLSVDTPYFVIKVSSTELKFAATAEDARDGTAVTLSSDGSGTNSIETEDGHLYVHLFDVAKNVVQSNPNFESTFVSNLPTNDGVWTNLGSRFTVTRAAVSRYSQGSNSYDSGALRLQTSGSPSGAHEVYLRDLSLTQGQAYEVSFWYKENSSSYVGEYVKVNCGYGNPATATADWRGGAAFALGTDEWQKITFQFVATGTSTDRFYILRRSSPLADMDILINDVSVVPVG